jgi:hypothetical protein
MLRDVRVGDRVRSVVNDWGTISKIIKDWIAVRYPHKKTSIYYHISGKNNKDDLYPEIVEVQKKKKWEPERGNYIIEADGDIYESKLNSRYVYKEGRTYPTQELAEKAYKMIRPYQRLVAYVLEHAPDWQPDWEDDDQYAYCIVYNHNFKQWGITDKLFTEYFTIHMPKNVAEELCEKLNSGEVEL